MLIVIVKGVDIYEYSLLFTAFLQFFVAHSFQLLRIINSHKKIPDEFLPDILLVFN